MSNVVTESELEAFRLINPRGVSSEVVIMKKVQEAADKIIDLAERIKKERLALSPLAGN